MNSDSQTGLTPTIELASIIGLVQLLVYRDSHKNTGQAINLLTLFLLVAFIWIVVNKVRVIQARSNPMIAGYNEPVNIVLNPADSSKTSILGQTLAIGSEPKQLPYGQPMFGELNVTCPLANSGDVFLADSPVGCSTGPRYVIAAGSEQTIKISEISNLYYFGTADDELAIFAEIKSS